MSKESERQEIPDHEPAPEALERRGEGPKDEKGLEASQLPDGGRGEAEVHKDLARKTPVETGGVINEDGERGDVGLRGTPDVADLHDNANKSGGPSGGAL